MIDLVVINSKGMIIGRNHDFTIQAQGCTGSFYTGGEIILSTGTGATIKGTIVDQVGSTIYLKETK